MRANVLIVPDKFKGTLSAEAAACTIARGWRSARPNDSLIVQPMSDGGDGFGRVMGGLLAARSIRVETMDAAHRPCKPQWWWEAGSKTAILESAGVIGLNVLPSRKFHPFDLDTFGLGLVIRAAADKEAKRCWIGIGGSATNDGGFGMARALGWRFLDRRDNEITRWPELRLLRKISAPRRRRWFDQLVVAVDVQNPLLGSRGATRVYGPQKGLARQEFKLAECCLGRLVEVLRKETHTDFSRVPGAGAAGGLGFGLMTFLDAWPEAGFQMFARVAKLDEAIRAADLVVTGEGACDESTFMGKGVGQIALRCRKWNVPCIVLAGEISSSVESRNWFSQGHSLTEICPTAQAVKQPAIWLERLTLKVARNWEPAHYISGPRKRNTR